jgi:List-Bact-rpt repeat protein
VTPLAPRLRASAARYIAAATPAAALFIVALFALPGASALGLSGVSAPGAPMHALAPVGTHLAPAPRAVASPLAPRAAPLAPHLPSAGPVASARGTFFSTAQLPEPAVGTQVCLPNYYATVTCSNITNDPSLNYTSRGLLAVAYTAYTNLSQCANVTNYTKTQVGFSSSSDNGTTWSTPIYLGNSNCSVAGDYPDAWTPSLTSLANGTLVLAYIEFNDTKYATIPNFYGSAWGPYSWSFPFDRLVLTESYDNGATWTAPTVLNSSSNPGFNASAFAPIRPWVTATGQTVYVTWMNDTEDEYYGSVASAGVHLLVSKDGGSTWLAPVELKTFGSNGRFFSFNPQVTVGAGGELYVTYGTNLSENTTTYFVTTDIEVARSTNNGTTFSYAVAVSGTGFVNARVPFHDPSPQLVYSAASGQLVLTFGSYEIREICYSYGCYPGEWQQVYVANSSDGGASWSAAHIVAPELTDFTTGFQLYNPSVAIGPTGTVDVEMTYYNVTVCGPGPYGSTYCGEQFQVFASSSDNGTTFSNVVTISSNATNQPYYPDGEYDTMLTVGSQVYVAWTIDLCTDSSLAYCSWPYENGNGVTDIQVSSLFQGTGFDLNFTETGLQPGTHWSVNVLGNVRSAAAPTALQVSGVPNGDNVSFNLSSPAAGYGVRYFGALSLLSPAVITANTTVTDTFSEQVLVNISSNPFIPGTYPYGNYCGDLIWDNPYCGMVNYNITPLPGGNWVTPGASIVLNVTNNSQWCYYVACFWNEVNLSFESWTGSGAGSVNTSSNITTIAPLGPVNETANFDLTGWCEVEHDPPYFSEDICWRENATVAFHESGLPVGQNWSVTVQGSGNVTTLSSNSSWIFVSGRATSSIAYYYVWSIPAGAGEFWVGSGSPAAPIELPTDQLISVTFTREAPSAAIFPLFVNQTGLPYGTHWSVSLGGTGYGVLGNGTSFALPGGSYALNASPIYFDNGTAYYANLVTDRPLVLNSSLANLSTPATLAVNGPTLAELLFTPAYYVTVSAGSGGSANASSQWVQSSRSVRLNATPDPGYSFVGWTGDGLGAVNSSHSAITVTPSGPVTEFAAFVHLPPPTWTVTVRAIGLPGTLGFTVGLGAGAYTGNGTFEVSGLSSGNYSVSVGYVYLNSSNLTRFVPTVTQSSYARNGAGALEIAGDGYVNVTFAPQYLLTLSSTGNGTISPSAGTYWETPSASVTVSATPDPHYRFVGWNGSGLGSANVTTLSVTLTLGSPVWETGQFLWAPNVPPKTFNLTVTESGLPGAASWLASVGTIGAHGSGTGLTIAGLNGSYTLVVPPVYVGTDTRYVANASSVTATLTVSIQANQTVSVSFTEQFLVTVASGSGGTASVSPTAGGWVNSGATVTLTATPGNATTMFANWTGTGPGAYTGSLATTTLTVDGPVTETAAFEPIYPAKTTGSTTAGEPLAFGLLAVLIVVGLLVGYLLFRRRSTPRAPPANETAPAEGDGPEDASGGPG